MAIRIDDVDLNRDRALVDACQAGNDAAFADLYRRYFARLHRFCIKRVGDVHEAEEIAQEAFARAYRAMPTFAGERRFYPWLTVIAARLCVDSHRRQARSEPTAEVDPGSIDGGQQAVIDRVDVEMLDLALQRLLPRHREVLDLREREGWSYKRIAEHYDVSLATVEMLIFRARQALRREFVAVAGDDRRYAAGAPVLLAWLYRRGGALRSKMAEWLPAASGPIVGPILSAALVAGSVAALAPTAGPPPVQVTTPAPAAAQVVPSVPQPAAVPAVADPAPAAAAVAARPTAAPAPAAAGRTSAPVLERRPAAQGRAFSEQAPVATDAGPVGVGADPGAVAEGTVEAVAGYVGQVTGSAGSDS